MGRQFWLALCLAFGLSSFLHAQPGAAPRAAAPPEFKKVYAEWKDLLSKLRQLQEKYPTAPAAKKPAMEAEFEQLLAKGKQLAPQILAAAEVAYIAEPNANKEMNDFLLSAVQDNVKNDNYEEAARLAKILIDHSFADKTIYNLAGIAAFVTNDYPNARKYLKIADDAGLLAGPAKGYQSQLPEYERLWAKEIAIRAVEAKANDLPRVKLATSKGDIIIELFENQAPIATANFISLVEKKFYDGLTFHRVIPGFMAQGGDPQGTGSGGPGYTIACECYRDDFRKHFRGTLSMAHAGRDTGGSQFFLTFVPTTHLDGKHTAFGRVIQGFEVLAKLERTEPNRGPTVDKIVTATVLRKRNHPYDPPKKAER